MKQISLPIAPNRDSGPFRVGAALQTASGSTATDQPIATSGLCARNSKLEIR